MLVDAETVKIFEVGDTFDVDYSCAPGDACPDAGNVNAQTFDVTATATWTVNGISGTSVEIGISVANTTSDPDSTTNGITQFGVKVLDPDATGASVSTASGFWTAAIDKNFPGFSTVDLFVDDSKPGDKGILEGEVEDFLLELDLASFSATDGLMLQIFPIKFAGIGTQDQSLEFAGTVTVGTPPLPGGGSDLPEPAPFVLIGLGGLMLGWMRRGLQT